jgi:pyruvate dehydrogenase E2 component (dihydrolipoamide acetyltransferase)
VISPLVRKLARENGVELRELTGTGPDGLITRADVETAIAAERAVTSGEPLRALPEQEGARTAPAGAEARYPLTGIRGLVADKMSRSRREIPEATCWVDADATELLAARAAMNGAVKVGGGDGRKVSLLALFARISVAALARYPMLNSTVDMEAREVVRLTDVHLGFAAQTDRGLVVPVVRNVDKRTTDSVNDELIRLTESAREGKLTPGELTGGTFTLNNYGVFGVDGSTPIINHPEAAMLGVGRIVPKPWVHQGELAVRHVVQLSLTFDHRVCDGGTAGGFLRYVADCVEQPAVLLRSV